MEEIGDEAFFTKPEIASECIDALVGVLDEYGFAPKQCHFLDTSAGMNEVASLARWKDTRCYDIALRHGAKKGIVLQDFLATSPPPTWLKAQQRSSHTLTVAGFNPPFGYQCALARKFFDHATSKWNADVVGFIIPDFWYAEHAHPRYVPVYEKRLGEHAFYYPDEGREFRLFCTFRVWMRHSLCGANADLLPAAMPWKYAPDGKRWAKNSDMMHAIDEMRHRFDHYITWVDDRESYHVGTIFLRVSGRLSGREIIVVARRKKKLVAEQYKTTTTGDLKLVQVHDDLAAFLATLRPRFFVRFAPDDFTFDQIVSVGLQSRQLSPTARSRTAYIQLSTLAYCLLEVDQ